MRRRIIIQHDKNYTVQNENKIFEKQKYESKKHMHPFPSNSVLRNDRGQMQIRTTKRIEDLNTLNNSGTMKVKKKY